MIARNRSRPSSQDYPDDIFDDTRMSFGDHIEELRTRMIRGLVGLIACMFVGFVLDAVGEATGNKSLGVGKPMLDVITDPVETQVRDFYSRRAEKESAPKLAEPVDASPEEIERVYEKLRQNDFNLTALTEEEKKIARVKTQVMPLILPTGPLADALGIPPGQVKAATVRLDAEVVPARLNYLSEKGQTLLGTKKYLATLSAQEGFVVYFKVSIICGLVLSSPWLLYQFWAFVGAGLYPHEKKYVYIMLWPSVILFLFGVLICQFFVLPGAVKALLRFNEFLGFDPDIRLNEWLGLALILPLVFGLSFQTPLVMIFFNRIGTFTAADYLRKWRYACIILMFFAAIITPTPDLITMLYLFLPMFGLYMAGILFCTVFPGVPEDDEDEPADEIAV